MHQLQKTTFRPSRPQHLDQAETETAATVHGNAGRLVDHQQRLVLVHHGLLHNRLHPGAGLDRGGPLLLDHGRNPDFIPGPQPGIGPGSPPIYPDLTLAHDTVNGAPGHAPKPRHQEIVQPLVGLILGHRHPLNRRAGAPGTRRGGHRTFGTSGGR